MSERDGNLRQRKFSLAVTLACFGGVIPAEEGKALEGAVCSASDFRLEGAVRSEGDPLSEGGLIDIEPPANTASPPRRSSRLIATKIQKLSRVCMY